MMWALITLGIVSAAFLTVCLCRCYPRIKSAFCGTTPQENNSCRIQPRRRPIEANYIQNPNNMAPSSQWSQNNPSIYPNLVERIEIGKAPRVCGIQISTGIPDKYSDICSCQNLVRIEQNLNTKKHKFKDSKRCQMYRTSRKEKI